MRWKSRRRRRMEEQEKAIKFYFVNTHTQNKVSSQSCAREKERHTPQGVEWFDGTVNSIRC